MRCIKFELTHEEEKTFEFRLYQFQGLQIAVNQFLHTAEFEYNDEHYQRLMETYVEKHRLLTESILALFEKRQYHNITVQNFNYEYVRGVLKVYLQQNGG